MTVRKLIETLQNLGEENLDREIIMFDGPSYYTPYKIEILEGKEWGNNLRGKVMIDQLWSLSYQRKKKRMQKLL